MHTISPNTSESPQIPPVPLAIPEVPVQLSALRTVMCTLSVYKTNEASSGLPEGERDEINNLPGRHTGDVRVSGGVDKTSKSDPGPVLCAGFDNQQQEITIVTSTGINISGAPGINSTNENFSPTGEDAEDLLQSNSSYREVLDNNSGASCICGNDQCSKTGYPHSSFVSSSHTGLDKQGGSSSRAERGKTTIPKNGNPHIGSPDRTAVVGQDCQDIQFCPTNTTTARSNNRDGCIPVGLGCQMPGAPQRRPLVSGGTDDAYQCSRTPSSLSCNQNLLQGEGLPQYSDSDRQHDCQSIHKPPGGTHSQTLNSIATQLWKWCLDHQVHLTAEYLPGVENKIADKESRVTKDHCDWMIHPEVFNQINTRLGPLEVDMFASRLTHQLPRFFSWGLDPAAEAVDAFNQDWSQFVGYANPPWCLILSVLAKILRDKARVILVAPVWSTQP